MLSIEQARNLAQRAVALTNADQAEALVIAESSALTRFANNRINQNVAESNALVSVRAVLGKRIGVASTNRLDDASLTACCEAAVASARVAPEDPGFRSLPEGGAVEADRSAAATREFSAEDRARAVEAIVAPSRSRGFTAAGKVRTAEQVVAVANSLGIVAAGSVTAAQATVLSMGPDDGSGWASFLSRDVAEFDPAALGEQAADLAARSANPTELEPGEYTVVLAPDAVADIMDFFGYVGFSAKAYHEGRSFMSNELENMQMTELVTIIDDARSEHAIGMPFDYEGYPKGTIPLVEYGVLIRPVTDSYWSHITGFPNSGHALPAPNSYGPMPLNLEMMPGDKTLDELIGSVERGVYVTRFHYVNVEDPVPVTLTGMTRDGTFLIENGVVTRPLKNLRFTQPMVEAFYWCDGVSSERRFVGTEEGASLVPSVLLSKFNFTGQTR